MYCLLGLVMLLRGFADAIMMRTQQALAIGAPGYLPPDHYDQIFSAHGTIMIFFGAMPFVIGLMNFVVPLQLGVRDVALPTLNSASFWLTASGALLVNLSLVIGEFARTSCLPYAPLSELAYWPGVGVDYYLWSIQISGVGTLLSGVNLVTTILKMRAPGMSYLRMPMFCWTALGSNMLIVATLPILTATLAMLIALALAIADGRAPSVLPPYHERAGRYQQPHRADLRRIRGRADPVRVDLYHRPSQPQQDADDRGARLTAWRLQVAALTASILRNVGPMVSRVGSFTYC
jgi:hypothetical protein